MRSALPVNFLSPGAENVISCLSSWGRSEGVSSFPPEWKDAGRRIKRIETEETEKEWFVDCVDNIFCGDVDRCKVEENLAVLMYLKWESKTNIAHACFHAIVVSSGDSGDSGDIKSFYSGKAGHWQYLRLDFDKNILGPIFKEPIPHIHIRPKGEPRFPLAGSSTGNIVMDFLDYVYRNYFKEEWLAWARSIWNGEVSRRKIEEDPFERIKAAFDTQGQYPVLIEEHRHHLEWMKNSFRQWKDNRFKLRVKEEFRSILAYNI